MAVIAGILKTLVGRSQLHMHNTQHFKEQIKDIILGLEECITSCDVTALLTLVPVAPALNIVQNK